MCSIHKLHMVQGDWPPRVEVFHQTHFILREGGGVEEGCGVEEVTLMRFTTFTAFSFSVISLHSGILYCIVKTNATLMLPALSCDWYDILAQYSHLRQHQYSYPSSVSQILWGTLKFNSR